MKKRIFKKKENELIRHIMKYSENYPITKINKNGEISNWNQLDSITKEDILESDYNNIDFSKSKAKLPALYLLKAKGIKYLLN